jgi:hypothetical protein
MNAHQEQEQRKLCVELVVESVKNVNHPLTGREIVSSAKEIYDFIYQSPSQNTEASQGQ